MPHVARPRFVLALLAWVTGLAVIHPLPLEAQVDHRIWGRVTTTTGVAHEGFIRWDRNEASWVDVLDGSKATPEENYRVWLDATAEGKRPTRALELKGWRITWDEEDPDFPALSASGIRFGHLARLIVTGDEEADLVLRSGERLTLSGGGSDLGRGLREVLVIDPAGGETEHRWVDIDRVDFSAPPRGVRTRDARLYGTVVTERGQRFEGYIGWDTDEALGSDILDGDDEEGNDRQIPFVDIRSIEGHLQWSMVTLRSGEVLELEGSNDVARGHRGVQISDAALGLIGVDWEAFESVEFHPPPSTTDGAPHHDLFAHGAFDGGHPLYGTVVTWDGDEYSGLVRWDADEQASWEFLDGSKDDVSYRIEFANIRSILQDTDLGVVVTLTDGRAIELDAGSDVDWDNRGIMVRTSGQGETAGGAAHASGPWLYLFLEDVQEVHFDHDRTRPGVPPGS